MSELSEATEVTLYGLVEMVEARFLARTNLSLKFGKGARAIAENDSIPRVIFEDNGGLLTQQGEQFNTGGADGAIYADLIRWNIHVWGKDADEAREIFFEILRSMRDEFGTSAVKASVYQMSPLVLTERSRYLRAGPVTVLSSVPRDTAFDFSLVQVEHFKTNLQGEAIQILQHAPGFAPAP